MLKCYEMGEDVIFHRCYGDNSLKGRRIAICLDRK